MIPLLTVAQMRDADADAVARVGVDALVAAAGTAVGLAAARMLGSCYGARVAVLAGPGLNGADGRVAARWLASRGAVVDVVEVGAQPDELVGYALVLDAAFGLGCSRPYAAPHVAEGTRVLAVDLPSGVDSDTGDVLGAPLRADVTFALGALKYAHVTGAAAALCGEIEFAGLGIVEHARDGLVEDRDLDGFVAGAPDDHKWSHAVELLAGSVDMPGAAALCARGALAGGASMVRLTTHGAVTASVDLPDEVVRVADGPVDPRCRCVVAGPGVGPGAREWLAPLLAGVVVPVVVDADGLDRALIPTPPPTPWVLTPHEGEFARLTGAPVPADRLGAVRALAAQTGCVVLLKGPTTIVAAPDGAVRVVRAGTSALATAGSGDVLAGLIGAAIARGHDAFTAAALGAHLHGRAGARLATYGTATELSERVASLLGRVLAPPMGRAASPLHHLTLSVTDADASAEWYQRVLGPARVIEREGPHWRRLVLVWPNGPMIGVTQHDDAVPGRFDHRRVGLDHAAITCWSPEEVHRWAARLDELGVEHGPVEEAGYGWAVTARDLDGIPIEFFCVNIARVPATSADAPPRQSPSGR